MDRLSFVFSLLLIVSVTTTTFGSVIYGKNPNGESLEERRSDPDLSPYMALKKLQAFLKRSHYQSNPDMKTDAQAKLQGQNGLKDQESEMSKRVDPENLIPGTVTLAFLREQLESSSPAPYKVAIDIENQSGFDWDELSTYFEDDTLIEPPLPDELPDGKSTYTVSRGKSEAGGVLVYYIKNIDSSLAMMYFVAYGQQRYWYVKMYDGDKRASEEMMDDMFSPSYEAKDQWRDGPLGFGLTYRVRMFRYAKATLEVHINKSK